MFLRFHLVYPNDNYNFDQVDNVFLVVFPIMFLSFHLVYPRTNP